ncbi:T9SS type A sorting domain-containing protein [candidate division KSB1 bacterium]|nr:T9SS type A sorting domain-containing protein [candidate division KSB1 bacterium]MBL7095191.1 T9SS type A sorting domain-containing protein [candidate division KSB1 bacterium]
MKNYRLVTIAILLFICTTVSFGQMPATLTMPDTVAALGDTISLPIKVSTTSEIGLAQFVIEYKSTLIEFYDAAVGNDAAGFMLSKNSNLPFSVTSSETDKNVLLQISGGGSGSFTGQGKEVVNISFIVKASSGKSVLIFDQTSNHTFLTTTSLSDIEGSNVTFEDGEVNCNPTAINRDGGEMVPEVFALLQNYPNPFNPETNIRFQIAKAGNVVVNVYSVLGEKICTLVDAEYEPGQHSVVWEGKDQNGINVASGIYFYQIETGNNIAVRKMMLMR